MREPNWKKCTEEELWKYVATHLKRNGIDTVLVGGAVVSIYSEGAYKSGDLDFVLEDLIVKNLPELMAEIGFRVEEGRHYKHPKCSHLFVEFQSPPCGIGEDTSIRPKEVKCENVTIKIYSPTDCIRDRLASYIHFKARECLDQAVLVGLNHPFNHSKIKHWCQSEGSAESYEDFLQALRVERKEK